MNVHPTLRPYFAGQDGERLLKEHQSSSSALIETLASISRISSAETSIEIDPDLKDIEMGSHAKPTNNSNKVNNMETLKEKEALCTHTKIKRPVRSACKSITCPFLKKLELRYSDCLKCGYAQNKRFVTEYANRLENMGLLTSRVDEDFARHGDDYYYPIAEGSCEICDYKKISHLLQKLGYKEDARLFDADQNVLIGDSAKKMSEREAEKFAYHFMHGHLPTALSLHDFGVLSLVKGTKLHVSPRFESSKLSEE